MKKRILSILTLCTLLLIFAVTQVFANRAIKNSSGITHGSSGTGPYRALIIAVNDYKDPAITDLKTPLNDAKKLDEILRTRYGFKTELLRGSEASRKGIYDALRSLAGFARSDESVLIYYAGHGDLDRQYDDGWWIPYDAKGGDAVTYLDNTIVQKAMRSTKARHVLLISDSCYSGSLFGSSRAVPAVIGEKYYRNMYSEKSRWGMTSGALNPLSGGGDGRSLFSGKFIDFLARVLGIDREH